MLLPPHLRRQGEVVNWLPNRSAVMSNPSLAEAKQAAERLAKRLAQAIELQKKQRSRDDAVVEPVLLFARALVNMRIRPALQPEFGQRDPVHVAMLGMTNNGKSTVLNLLLGTPAAGMNALARFTQHPEAYYSGELGHKWLDDYPSRFDSYQRYENRHPPTQTAAELETSGYRKAFAIHQFEHVTADRHAEPSSQQVVFWDAPDFSTEEGQLWLVAVLDAVAIADLVIFVVTEQAYADDRGLKLWRMISASGVAVQVIANRWSQSFPLNDLRDKLGTAWQGPPEERHLPRLVRLPNVDAPRADERLKILFETEEVQELRESIGDSLVEERTELKSRALRGAVQFLRTRWPDLVRPLQQEVQLVQSWQEKVKQSAQKALFKRYREEYLQSDQYKEFNLALLKLMDLLEVPVVGQALKVTQQAVALPMKMVGNFFQSRFGGPPKNTLPPEEEKLNELIRHWLGDLQAEAQSLARSSGNPIWEELAKQLHQVKEGQTLAKPWKEVYQSYRESLQVEIEKRADAIYAHLQERPRLLNTLRASKLGINLSLIGLAVAQGGINWWDAAIAPLVAGLQQEFLKWGLQTYVDRQQEELKQVQFEMLTQRLEEAFVGPVGELMVASIRPDELTEMEQDLETTARKITQLLSGGLFGSADKKAASSSSKTSGKSSAPPQPARRDDTDWVGM